MSTMDNTEKLASNITTEVTDLESDNQANKVEKTYTQDEVDNLMARIKGSLQKKLLKPYEDLGDPDELRSMKAAVEKQQTDEQLKRGEFEKTLQALAEKKDSEIQKRDSIIREYKINTPLLNSAAKLKSINPEQVKTLLVSQTRLNLDGDVEVIDSNGLVRYNDDGTQFTTEQLVKSFLDINPHFVNSTPATTLTKSNASGIIDNKLDISKLNMKKQEDRDIYREYRKTQGLT